MGRSSRRGRTVRSRRWLRGGFVRVILTTNFDRLIEEALAEAGVAGDGSELSRSGGGGRFR